ncbi:hypothetical protein [Streptomyces sp. MH60]|uniref:hypothetical protein n=1 Tax=Streptomyces sp. MH60 TaxID=1940758 RepID=UPI000CEF07A9|nr:hypothetical protein [Streptomyces sp. MH60]PPS86440.1 hypothetical protein BZZ08_03407 [Streptomyces sp. MH60]
MKYLDRDGDTWETLSDSPAWLLCTKSKVDGFAGQARPTEDAETEYGPLRPVSDDAPIEPLEAPSAALPSTTDVMERGDIFRAAHALVRDLEWDEREYPAVFDVLSVAKWLEGSE